MIPRTVIMYGLLLLLYGCGQSDKMINTPPPTVEKEKEVELTFAYEHVDFGNIQQGDQRDTTYTFVNTGNENIIIDLVSACECTTFDYPRQPIKPGDRGEIPIIFDSSKKEESETITVDIILRNTHPEQGSHIVYQLSYDFNLINP